MHCAINNDDLYGCSIRACQSNVRAGEKRSNFKLYIFDKDSIQTHFQALLKHSWNSKKCGQNAQFQAVSTEQTEQECLQRPVVRRNVSSE